MANPSSTIYNIPYLLRISPHIDLDLLAQAIAAAVANHPCLDVRLALDDDGEVRQHLANESKPFAPAIMEGLNKASLVRSFDLLGGRLFRVEIHATQDGTFLFVDAHHIVADGTSLSVLLDDINRAYAGEALEPETYSLLDAALAEQDMRKSDAYGKAEDFYRKQFTNCVPTTDLTHDHEQPPARCASLLRTSTAVGPAAVEMRCKELGITPNAFFVGAFGAVLARYNFQHEATFATIYHGRNEARLARAAGMFVKTLPVRVNTKLPSKDYFAAVRDLLMGCMDHDVYPFAEVSRAYGVAPTMMLAYQGSNFNMHEFCGEPAELILLDLDAAKEPLILSVATDGDAHIYDLQYRADLYDKATMGWFIDNLELALSQFVEGRDPVDLQLLFDEAPHMVNVPAHAGKTFVDLFAEAVAAHPERIAVRDSKSQLTYAELDVASAAVAAALRQTGFGPEQYACVLAGRTKEFMVGVVGVMRAGGAYVPMDPDYPADLFEHRCVRSLAAVVQQSAPNATADEAPAAAGTSVTDGSETTNTTKETTTFAAPQGTSAHINEMMTTPDAYDYSSINALLANNVSANVDDVADEGLGEVLLTGATGFLGIHVLHDYLNHHEGRIWCLVRKGSFQSPERRLANLLMYYFERPYTEYFGERIMCIDADISNPNDVAALDRIPFRTLVNCAACVKHFAAGDELDRANVQGVQQLVNLCSHGRRRLVHISTISTAGKA